MNVPSQGSVDPIDKRVYNEDLGCYLTKIALINLNYIETLNGWGIVSPKSIL